MIGTAQNYEINVSDSIWLPLRSAGFSCLLSGMFQAAGRRFRMVALPHWLQHGLPERQAVFLRPGREGLRSRLESRALMIIEQ